MINFSQNLLLEISEISFYILFPFFVPQSGLHNDNIENREPLGPVLQNCSVYSC